MFYYIPVDLYLLFLIFYTLTHFHVQYLRNLVVALYLVDYVESMVSPVNYLLKEILFKLTPVQSMVEPVRFDLLDISVCHESNDLNEENRQCLIDRPRNLCGV